MKFSVPAAILVSTICTIFNAGSCSGAIPWPDYLIPLPHEIAVSSTVRIAPDQVGFVTSPDASAAVTQAVAELRAAWQTKSGCVPDGTAFVITIGRLSDDGRLNGKAVEGADRIKQVKSPDQAYLIRPLGSNGLVVAAWNDKGVFYGIQTLTQLLTAQLTKTEAVIPMAIITDWPDMDERGLWNTGYSTPGLIPWMAAIKLNFTHISSGIIFKKDAPAECVKIPMDLIRQANDRAFHLVPHTPHHDEWTLARGFTNIYPELVGKGNSAVNPMNWIYPGQSFQSKICPCASNQKFKELLTDWVRSAADQGARELSIWLTEFSPCQCACANCMKNGPRQFQLETAASLDALKTVQKQYPDLIGRICITLRGGVMDVQPSAECLALLAAAPPAKIDNCPAAGSVSNLSANLSYIAMERVKSGIKAEKHYGRNKAFDDYAASGNWVATYNGISLQYLLRYAGSVNARNHILDYYTNHYSALISLVMLPVAENIKGDFEKTFGAYQLHAMAEWTWNANGRDPRAFARAFATRRNMPAPGQFAAWIETIEPAQNLFLTLPRPAAWEQALAAPAARRPLPDKFPKPEALTNCLAACDRAIPLATAAGDTSVMEETLFLKDYFQALAQLAAWHAAVVASANNKPLEHESVAPRIKAIRESLASSAAHLEKQMALLAVDPKAGPDVFLNQFRQFVTTVDRRLEAAGRNEVP